MNAAEALRLTALRDVYFARNGLADEHGFNLRRIFRWYSHYFCTPLHVVEALPQIDVVRAYWEQRYEDLDDEQLEDAVRQSAMTESDLRAADAEDDMKEVDLYVAKAVEKRAKAIAEKKQQEQRAKTMEAIRTGRRPPPPPKLRDRDVELVANPDLDKLGGKLPPNISMTFINDDDEIDLEQDGVGFGLLAKSKPGKK
jgi:hypothetical protein